MKVAFFNFVRLQIFVLCSFVLHTNANDLSFEPLLQVNSLKDSPSIGVVRDFMNEVHNDLETYYVINERNLKLPTKHQCFAKNKSEVVRFVTKSIMHTLKMYPDEELPVVEAIADLKKYLKADSYEMCTFTRIIKEEKYEHSLFYSLDGTFYLRLDFVAPVN